MKQLYNDYHERIILSSQASKKRLPEGVPEETSGEAEAIHGQVLGKESGADNTGGQRQGIEPTGIYTKADCRPLEHLRRSREQICEQA